MNINLFQTSENKSKVLRKGEKPGDWTSFQYGKNTRSFYSPICMKKGLNYFKIELRFFKRFIRLLHHWDISG